VKEGGGSTSSSSSWSPHLARLYPPTAAILVLIIENYNINYCSCVIPTSDSRLYRTGVGTQGTTSGCVAGVAGADKDGASGNLSWLLFPV